MVKNGRRDEVAHALEQILKSETFSRSERARDLLRYLVGKEQEGEAERLKGFSIGVDVFGKDSGFDPATDAVVRVQAGRLRQLLDQYYQVEAPPSLLRIDIPRGTYVPVYGEGVPEQKAGGEQLSFGSGKDAVLVDLSGEAIHGALAKGKSKGESNFDVAESLQRIEDQQKTTIAKPLSRHFGLLWIAMGIVIGLLVAVTWMLRSFENDMSESTKLARGSEAQVEQSSLPDKNLLPTVTVVSETSDERVTRIAGQLRSVIPAFAAVQFKRSSQSPPADGSSPPNATDYRFVVGPDVAADRVSISLENTSRQQIIWSSEYPLSDSGTISDARMAGMLTKTLADEGVIYADIASHGKAINMTQCILLNSAYYKKQNDQSHRKAYECFDELRGRGLRSPIIYSELAILTMEAVTDKREVPENPSAQMAEELARRAVDLGPQNAYAYRAMGFVLSKSGNEKAAVDWARKAYEANRNDLSLAASYGYVLTLTSGQYEEAVKVLKPAVEAASAHPAWWDYALFMAYLMTDQPEMAHGLSERLKASRFAHYKALRLIAAHGRGDQAETTMLLNDLNSSTSSFAADPAAYYQRAGYPGDLVKTLLEEFAKAGFVKSS